MEKWKPVKGFENAYEISNEGNVRSVDRVDLLGRKRKGRKMAINFSGDGYGRVTLNHLGKRRKALVHRLVAESFIQEVYGLNEVNHIDLNKSNNHVSNLEWIDRRDNIRHAFANGAIKRGKGSELYNSKLNNDSIVEIKKMRQQGMSVSKIAKVFNVDDSTISAVVRGVTWRHVIW